ncbi:MAG: lytic transglycosylase domain-containing protein [Spirochaetota bacterium]
MPQETVFQNIQKILGRIDEIKRRFAPGNFSSRFDKELDEQNRKLSQTSQQVQKTGSTQPRKTKKQASENPAQTVKNISYQDVIKAASEKYSVPRSLIKAVIKQESNFDTNAVSEKGAMGLMQLMPDTAQLMGVENPFDARQNILGGVRYLRMLLDMYNGNLNKALAAYNAGPSRVNDTVPGIKETQGFIQSVISNYNQFSHYGSQE